MSNIIKLEDLQDQIIEIRDTKVLIDSDVAEIYGVKTRDINKAVGNNPENFPEGYVFELSNKERSELVENFHRFNRLKHSTVNPKAFTEKGTDTETSIELNFAVLKFKHLVKRKNK